MGKSRCKHFRPNVKLRNTETQQFCIAGLSRPHRPSAAASVVMNLRIISNLLHPNRRDNFCLNSRSLILNSSTYLFRTLHGVLVCALSPLKNVIHNESGLRNGFTD